MDLNDFIYVKDDALEDAVCKRLIELFEKCPNKLPGRVGHFNVNTELHKSTDVDLYPNPEFKSLIPAINASCDKVYKEYSSIFPKITQLPMRHTGLRIKRTLPGEYYNWHIDDNPYQNRQFVLIWYLNDVFEGGHTEFKFFNRAIQPKMGRVLMAPTHFTHEHRGVTPVSGVKYICRAFLSTFLPDEK
jgi:hypothetical protein